MKIAGFVTLAALSASLACDSPTDTTPAGADVRGTWEYEATQSGSALRVDGELILSAQDGSTFSGSLQMRETDASGAIRLRSGMVTGRLVQGGTIDFDVHFDEDPRRHVGALAGDSISGSWLQPEGNATITGAFTAHREATP